MKAKLLIDGKEIEVNISEEEYKKLQPSEEKKTGYERVSESDIYFYAHSGGYVGTASEDYCNIDNEYYELANYYSDKTVAENNARADRLMRQLRRFAVEHRANELNWYNINNRKYYITYDFEDNKISANYKTFLKGLRVTYFDSMETAQAAIDEFHDELIWYFTEYKDSL